MALEMLQQVLDPARWDLELIAPATLTAELLDLVAERRPGVVCIASTPPGGLAHTRYLCKRLRSRFPELKIVVGRWGAHDITTTDAAREAGADRAAATVKEAAAADAASATAKEVGRTRWSRPSRRPAPTWSPPRSWRPASSSPA